MGVDVCVCSCGYPVYLEPNKLMVYLELFLGKLDFGKTIVEQASNRDGRGKGEEEGSLRCISLLAPSSLTMCFTKYLSFCFSS